MLAREPGANSASLAPVAADRVIDMGPASMRDHHLVPQAMTNDSNFMAQMKSAGIADPADYFHRQIAQIPNAQHIDVHEDGWIRTGKLGIKKFKLHSQRY